jgi:hypothetical protein
LNRMIFPLNRRSTTRQSLKICSAKNSHTTRVY